MSGLVGMSRRLQHAHFSLCKTFNVGMSDKNVWQ